MPRELLEADFREALSTHSEGQPVPGAQLGLARLKAVARHVADLVQEAGARAELLAEARLSILDGALVGIVDLVIDGPDAHIVVDFKTGAIHTQDGHISARYVKQVQIYAAMEQERTGRWPSHGILLPFGAGPERVPIDPAVCVQAAADAVAALARYNEIAGSRPAGNATDENCRFCPYAPRCPEYWAAREATWSPGALEGRVTWIEHSAAGASTLGLATAADGQSQEAIIRRLPISPTDVSVGAQLAIVGIGPDADGRYVCARDARYSTDPLTS